MTAQEDFKTPIHRDTFDILAGQHIGAGSFRDVWTLRCDHSCVLKFETTSGSFYNIYEHELWQEVKDDKVLSQWFAPVLDISANGIVLVQRRTYPVRKEDLPTKVPAFFDDLKANNWGWYEGRVVCHDFGHRSVLRTGLTKRMKTAKWWA